MSAEERHYCILTEPHSFSNISCGHLWSVSDSVKPVRFQLVSILDSIIVGYGFVANAHNASRHIVARRPLMCCPFQTHWNSQISQFLVSDQCKSVIVFKWAIYATTYIIKPHFLCLYMCMCLYFDEYHDCSSFGWPKTTHRGTSSWAPKWHVL